MPLVVLFLVEHKPLAFFVSDPQPQSDVADRALLDISAIGGLPRANLRTLGAAGALDHDEPDWLKGDPMFPSRSWPAILLLLAACRSDLDATDGTESMSSTGDATGGTTASTSADATSTATSRTTGTSESGTDSATGSETGACGAGSLDCSCGPMFACDAGLFCVADTCSDVDPFDTLKMGIDNPEGLAVDGHRVYYAIGTEGNRSIRVHDVAENSDSLVFAGNDRLRGLAARSGQVWFIEQTGNLTRVDADNLADVEIIPVTAPWSLAVGPEWVAVGQYESDVLLFPLANLDMPKTVPWSTGSVAEMYVSATHLLVGTQTEGANSLVYRMALSESELTWVHDQPYWVTGIAAVGLNMYWTSMGWPPDGGEILRKPLQGGGEIPIASTTDMIWGLATDGTSIFWTEPGDLSMGDPGKVGRVMRHTPGVGTGPVATEQWLPFFIAFGTDSVYWINMGDGSNGSLERRRK